MINVTNLTLTYPSGKGVFGLNFAVQEGEVMGYLGPNGAGKTTTIRALLGFMRPHGGACSIRGLDCSQNAPEIQRSLGYIPGEITFLDDMNGDEFLDFICNMRGTRDRSRQKRLLDMFELDPKGRVNRFSKGMKQKLGIVTAFMHDPDVLILDEPTSGLDPLMQNRFIELVLEEKARGRTILMSSHLFEEVEETCDDVLIIKDGRIVHHSDVRTLKTSQRKGFVIKPADMAVAVRCLADSGFEVSAAPGDTIEVFVTGDQVDGFIKAAAQVDLVDFDVVPQSLEDAFMRFYGSEGE
jgi:ABC-2 type transport system ATP-binding protein